jgi:hypothetical protein
MLHTIELCCVSTSVSSTSVLPSVFAHLTVPGLISVVVFGLVFFFLQSSSGPSTANLSSKGKVVPPLATPSPTVGAPLPPPPKLL